MRSFLRQLAERLHMLLPDACSPERVALLHQLADQQLMQAMEVDDVRAKVAAVRADKRTGLDFRQALERFHALSIGHGKP